VIHKSFWNPNPSSQVRHVFWSVQVSQFSRHPMQFVPERYVPSGQIEHESLYSPNPKSQIWHVLKSVQIEQNCGHSIILIEVDNKNILSQEFIKRKVPLGQVPHMSLYKPYPGLHKRQNVVFKHVSHSMGQSNHSLLGKKNCFTQTIHSREISATRTHITKAIL